VRTYAPKASEIERKWFVVDAENLVLGRMSTEVARILRGKHKPTFAPYLDCGDHVIIVNASKVVLTNEKAEKKLVHRHSGYPGGIKSQTYADLLSRQPEDTVRRTIKGMLPKNRLGAQMLTKLKVYAGSSGYTVVGRIKGNKVYAGASGYVLFLDAVLTVADGRPLPEPPEVSMAAAPLAVDREATGLGLDGGRYEVMFFLDAADDTVPGFKDAWGELGDSVVVVGGDGVWNCHVHTDDIGAAVEAGIAVGRPHRIRISDLLEEAEEQAWVREQIGGDEPEGEPVSCAVVAVANGPGIVEIFRSLGVHRVVAGGQSMNPSTADLLAAVEAVPAGNVIILPNNGNIVAVAEQVDAQTDKTVRVVRTKSITEGFSSLLEYDPEGTADGNLGLMGEAAAAVVAAEVTVAVRDSGSEAGDIATGDHLGLSGGKVRVIAGSLLEATTRLLDELLDGDHELVTLIAGDDADEITTARVVAHVEESHPHVEVEVHEGGQPLYPYFVGIE